MAGGMRGGGECVAVGACMAGGVCAMHAPRQILRPRHTVNEGGGKHPTGMHSCC